MTKHVSTLFHISLLKEAKSKYVVVCFIVFCVDTFTLDFFVLTYIINLVDHFVC